MTDTIRDRFINGDSADPAEALVLVPGDMRDYRELSAHHYRAARPATATRVLTLRHTSRTAADRFADQPATRQAVAVLVESMPSLACRMRDYALRERYGAWLDPQQRALLLNREVRVISRVIVHPAWRGLGLAVRLVRAALDEPTTPYTEALAAMGRVNPFFERAGMTAYHRPPHPCDTRLIDALQAAGFTPHDLVAVNLLSSRIASLEPDKRDWLNKELRRWHRHNGGRGAVHDNDPMAHLKAARNRLMLQPVYYLHDNRDKCTNDKCTNDESMTNDQ